MRIRWRGLELPSRVVPDQDKLTDTYGLFIAAPFERGFGTTIGNSLRRLLLSSLEGSAITEARIRGVQHEFTTIPGVVEDVTDICLNFKSLIVDNQNPTTRTIRIEKDSAGVVTGGDVETDGQVEVINTDLILATLTDNVPFHVELTVENGRGYLPADDRGELEPEIGVIPLDATFSPVIRVRYKIEETRVGQRTNYERLLLEIWTNGVVTPEMALIEAAKILRKHLNPFITYREPGPEVAPDNALQGMSDLIGYGPVDLELEETLNKSLAELNLSVRATNCLESEGITTVRDLVGRSEDELLTVRNFGETTLVEVRERLESLGLRLGMNVANSTPS